MSVEPMAIGQVPVQMMCSVADGFKLHIEDVAGLGIPMMSMGFSMKMSFPVHELLNTLVSWQEQKTEPAPKKPSQKTSKEAGSSMPETFKAEVVEASALRSSPAYADYKAQNGWERISCPNVVVLSDVMRLREVPFAPLQVPERESMTYAKMKGLQQSESNKASNPSDPCNLADSDLGRPKASPPSEKKAPPFGWPVVKAVPTELPAPPAVQHKAAPAWNI